MKISITKHDLNEAIQQVSRAYSARPVIPILGGIKIEALPDGIYFTASDTEIAVQRFIPIDDQISIEETGAVVVQGRFFNEIAKKLPLEEVTIESNHKFETIIKSGHSEIEMKGLDPEDFPLIPEMIESKSFMIQGDLVKSMIRQTSFAASTNEQNAQLTGLRWSFQEGELKFVATDRHRLALRTATIQDSADQQYPIIILASRTVNELAKLVMDDDQIEISMNENQVLFKINQLLFHSKVLDGVFPDVDKVIPTKFLTELKISTKLLTDAIDRAYLLSREEKTNIVRIATQPNQSIEVSSSSNELGKFTEVVEVNEQTGEEIIVSFNSKYMLDALKVIDSDEIFIGLNGSMRAIILRAADHTQNLHLIVPYRTN